MMTVDQAIRYMRQKPRYAELIHDAYLGLDVAADGERFAASAEFREVMRLVGERVRGGAVLDLGAGAGVASYAFAVNGARVVYAIEPDLSDEIGAVAVRRMAAALPIHSVASVGERLPLPRASVDIVYARQVLHHTRDLFLVTRECARVLRPGGMLLASREHVVDNVQQLHDFLKNHPVHALAGGENAFSLCVYRSALQAAGLKLVHEFGPWDSLMNAFPEVRSEREFNDFPRLALRRRLGPLEALLSPLPGTSALVWHWLRTRRRPGRLFSFLASKQ